MWYNKSMKIAIIYDDGRVYVEFSPEKFLGLFIQYFNETKDIEQAMSKIMSDLKKETLTK